MKGQLVTVYGATPASGSALLSNSRFHGTHQGRGLFDIPEQTTGE